MKPISKKSIAAPRTQRLLELPAILARLENAAACALGRARAQALAPLNDAAKIRRALQETSQARRFLDAEHSAPFGGLTDIALQLKRASIGALLEPNELIEVLRFAAGARRLKAAIEAIKEAEYSRLHKIAGQIAPRPDLERAINDAIDEGAGQVKDDASLELLRARKAIRQTQNSIQSKLRAMLSDSHVQPHLQDAFVTMRDGRYCLPVRAESRNSVPGIVHDRSGSGGAFFIEPQAVVDLNNRLRELVSDEREAVRQILKQLTEYIAGAENDLRFALEACADLDFVFAKARLSLAMHGSEPDIIEYCRTEQYSPTDCSWELRQARHPLIEKPIANDIILGGEFDVILITGPTTGGKTVVLKTLGLLTLMAACGLHIPANAGSRVCLPGEVYADIGDEQSIEQSLSTFSSHMTQIIQVLKKAQAGDLILLDEVGAGTDPDEGAALAKSVLRSLQRRGARVVATTHYGELKQFALGAERFVNASVEFDTGSLQPTYHLRIGVPGASNAIDIAARLGLPKELAQRARRYLGRERAEAEAATQKLEETHRELSEQTQNARERHEEIEKLRAKYETRLEKLQAEVVEARKDAQREARELVNATREEADAVLRDLRRAGRESKETEEARERFKTLSARVEPKSKATAISNIEQRISKAEERPAPAVQNLKTQIQNPIIGDAVKVRSLNKEGVLLSTAKADGRVEVRIGAMKVKVPSSDVVKIETPADKKIRGVAAIQTRKSFTIEDEVNLIGLRTDEALMELEKFFDDAILAGADELRIVHGKGSGALRKAVHEWLRSQVAVTEFGIAAPNDGGEGATVVQFG